MNADAIGLLILRAVVGLTFATHGAQKAFGWWSGPGWTGWQKAIERMGMQPTGTWAAISVGAELIGGSLLAIGLFTPVAAAALIAQSIVIVLLVHLPNGFFNARRGIEFPLSLGAGAVALGLLGPGGISVDAMLGFVPSATIDYAFVAVGIVGGLAATAVPRLAVAARDTHAPEPR